MSRMRHLSMWEHTAHASLSVEQWNMILDKIEDDEPMLAILIEAQVNAQLGQELRPPSDGDDSGASKPKGGR